MPRQNKKKKSSKKNKQRKKADCKTVLRTLIFDQGTIYNGETKNGIAHGQGKLTFTDGSFVEGEFKNDKPDGHAKFVNPLGNGYYFEGEFEDGTPRFGTVRCLDAVVWEYQGHVDEKFIYHGLGKWTNGHFNYEGEFEHGQFHGKGKLTDLGGGVFVGEWRNNKMHGPIKYTTKDGAVVYETVFEQGVPNKNGHLVLSNGTLINGEGLWGKKEGKATVNFPSGNILVGVFQRMEPEWVPQKWIGKMNFADGRVFEGEFVNWKPQWSTGKLTLRDGTVFEGEWDEIKNKGNGILTDTDGSMYVGDVRKSSKTQLLQCHGNGKRTMADSSSYEGQWYKDLLHGKGKQIWSDGSWYEGEFHRGYAHGHGKWVRADGSIKFEGNVEMGQRRRVRLDDDSAFAGVSKKC